MPAAPRNAVQHHVARVRAALGQETIVASLRSGRQPDALEVFGEARRVLSEGLALEPGPDLR